MPVNIVGTEDGLTIGINIDNIPLQEVQEYLGIDDETFDGILNAMEKG